MPATGSDKVREGFDPLPPGYQHVPYNDLPAIEAAIDDQTVAVLVEPIQGEGGVNVPDEAYLPGLRQLCDQHDLLLIFDEVWTGCGRTGRWFSHQHWNVTPDIMTLAKGIGGGLAVGAMCAKPELAELYNARTQGGVKHATTLGGNCLSMAVAARVFDVIQRDRLVEHADQLGRHAVQRLERMSAPIRQVRGRGLFIGIELDPDGPFQAARDVVQRAMEQGLLINATQERVLRLAPALTITQEELDDGLDRLEAVLTAS